MRVLIIDSHYRSRESMKAILNASTHIGEYHEAADLNEAIRYENDFQPEVILLSMGHQYPAGWEDISRIKSIWKTARIIALSVNPSGREQALAAGADGFVSKTDPSDQVREILQGFLRE